MDHYAEKASAYSATLGHTSPALNVTESPALTSRIDNMLDETFSILMEATGVQSDLIGRLFGYGPPQSLGQTGKGDAPVPTSFENRVIERMQAILNQARTVRGQANELTNRI